MVVDVIAIIAIMLNKTSGEKRLDDIQQPTSIHRIGANNLALMISILHSKRLSIFVSANLGRRFATVNVGDKIPINYLKDVAAPVVKEDSEYPAWLKSIAEKAPSKAFLDRKFEVEGVDSMTVYEMKRLKKLLTRGHIKANNASKILDTES